MSDLAKILEEAQAEQRAMENAARAMKSWLQKAEQLSRASEMAGRTNNVVLEANKFVEAQEALRTAAQHAADARKSAAIVEGLGARVGAAATGEATARAAEEKLAAQVRKAAGVTAPAVVAAEKALQGELKHADVETGRGVDYYGDLEGAHVAVTSQLTPSGLASGRWRVDQFGASGEWLRGWEAASYDAALRQARKVATEGRLLSAASLEPRAGWRGWSVEFRTPQGGTYTELVQAPSAADAKGTAMRLNPNLGEPLRVDASSLPMKPATMSEVERVARQGGPTPQIPAGTLFTPQGAPLPELPWQEVTADTRILGDPEARRIEVTLQRAPSGAPTGRYRTDVYDGLGRWERGWEDSSRASADKRARALWESINPLSPNWVLSDFGNPVLPLGGDVQAVVKKSAHAGLGEKGYVVEFQEIPSGETPAGIDVEASEGPHATVGEAKAAAEREAERAGYK